MCQQCGCQQFIKAGKKVILKRAVAIVGELHLKPSNVDDYECTEAISALIAPFSFAKDEVYQTASWISGLHDRGERYQAQVRAFKEVFARLPIQGDPKQIATTYHQLEQLARELDETTIASLDSDIQQAIQAVNRVHEDTTRQKRLKERYSL